VSRHPLALLDTSCVIDPPSNLTAIADAFAVSTLTIAQLAYGLHTDDPVQAALREERYRRTLMTFDPVPYSAGAAHLYGAISAAVRRSGRSPRPRRIDLMLASVAAELSAVVVTRNPNDFAGTESIVGLVAV
jgi:predicted nucleic acid-binding protein